MTSLRVAVAGNPNVGKTSLFNLLTGSRYKVGNYPGVTVETREGRLRGGQPSTLVTLIDLPGTYSLTPLAEDEAVAFRTLTTPQPGNREASPHGGRRPSTGGVHGREDKLRPDAVLLVLDASNLARNLYLALQIFELGLPIVVALNMIDLAQEAGVGVEAKDLEALLGLPVIPTVGRTGVGVDSLIAALERLAEHPSKAAPRILDPGPSHDALRTCLAKLDAVPSPARARWLLGARAADGLDMCDATPAERAQLDALPQADVDQAIRQLVELRYAEVDRLLARLPARTASGAADGRGTTATDAAPTMRRSARIDAVLTHRILGPLTFLVVMALVFQSIFSWAEPLMGFIESGVGLLSEAAARVLGPGLFTDLLTEGVIAGVGNVVVFVPQIALLFLFIGLLEDSGYMARAAFIVDRAMARVGLNGKAFVPLLSGYACAIPAIMSARTISSFKDRVVTILMIPFMSCSARLPVYTLLIGAMFVANRRVLGPFTEGGLILLSMYLLGTVSALLLGAVYKRTMLTGPVPPLVLELPPYRLPRVRDTLRQVADRTADFLRDAGTIILAVTIVLWGLLSFPRVDEADLAPGETAIERSYAGQFGKALEPALEPIGQDWRIGIGLIGSFAAREVLVSTLGLVYGIENAEEDDAPLRETIRDAKDEAGNPRYSKSSALALMVFFVYACQCMSTLAVVRRETRSWKWPIFMLVSMTGIAYLAALVVFQGGKLFGL
jgi:ferrous iron transport protein B